jgi:hypothetical protein
LGTLPLQSAKKLGIGDKGFGVKFHALSPGEKRLHQVGAMNEQDDPSFVSARCDFSL